MQGNLSFSYLFPLAHNELPFPSFHISFTSSRIGIPFLTPNTVLIPFPTPSPPNQLPSLNFSPPPSLSWNPRDPAAWCTVQLIAVLLHLCNCIHCHLRTRRKYLRHSEQEQLASRRSHFRFPSPASSSSPATLALLQHFPIFHPAFRALLHQPFSGSAWQRLLRFGGELSEPPVGLPRIPKSSSGREKCPTLF